MKKIRVNIKLNMCKIYNNPAKYQMHHNYLNQHTIRIFIRVVPREG